MSVKPPLGDPATLNKRIVASAKYAHVGSTVDCGTSTLSARRQSENAEPSSKPRPGELFKRIRCSTLAALVLEAQTPAAEPLAEGVPQPPQRTFLLLDVREREDYEKCHVVGAQHYPFTMLSRSMNIFTAEILAHRNKEGHAIVLYDLDEEILVTRRIGNIFFEKGVDNVFVLSGGLKEFVNYADPSIIQGESPVPVCPKVVSPLKALNGRLSSATSTAANSTATSHKPKSLATSLARRASETSAWR
jgi:centrosomal protein CEP41